MRYKFQPHNIRKARIHKEQSLEDLAEKLSELMNREFRPDSLRKWETGSNTPNARQIAMLATALQTRLEYFFVFDLSLEQADLNRSKEVDTISSILAKVQDIESRITPDTEDPALYAIRHRKPLRELIETLSKLSDESLIEAKGLIQGYLVGKGARQQDQADQECVG